MLRPPSQLTYNDLNGKEAKQALMDWFEQFLSQQPLLQPHLTLPMAKIMLNVDIAIDMYVGGTVPIASPPERLGMEGAVVLSNDLSPGAGVDRATGLDRVPEHREQHHSTVINAAPIAGGSPPDRIREQHDLPISRPGYGDRETGRHLFLGDIDMPVEPYARPDRPGAFPISGPDPIRVDAQPVMSETGGREGIVADGYVFSREPAAVGPAASVEGGVEQRIPVDRGAIEIDLTGEGKMRQGNFQMTAGSHIASKKVLGDQGGAEYGSVSGTYDAGPAGLARPGRGGGGLYSDGRSRIGFGNQRK